MLVQSTVLLVATDFVRALIGSLERPRSVVEKASLTLLGFLLVILRVRFGMTHVFQYGAYSCVQCNCSGWCMWRLRH